MAKETIPKDTFPYATAALLLACAGATLAFDRSGGSDIFVCYPREPMRLLGAPALLSLFTHEGFPHLLLNSLLLLPAGMKLEARAGARKLFALFFFSGLAGILGQAYVSDGGVIGASGAISGLVFALFFRGRVELGGFEALAVAWFCSDLLGLQSQLQGHYASVSHASHIAGAVAGAMLSLAFFRPPVRVPARSGP